MGTILLATGDGQAQGILEAELSVLGDEVLCATDGTEALELAEQHRPGLILLDMRLEVFSGLEVCDQLRAAPNVPKGLPIFLLTDENVDVRLLEKHDFTGRFPKTHPAQVAQDLLVTHLYNAPEWLEFS